MEAAGRRMRAAATVRRLGSSVGAKLFGLLFGVLLVTLGLLGWANVSLHRQHLEASRLTGARRITDVIRRSTSYYMMRNDRDALQHIVETTGGQQAIDQLRIYNNAGRIGFSTERAEIGTSVAAAMLPRPGANVEKGSNERFLRVVAAIPNSPGCSTGACHAHPASDKTLGYLESTISLASEDRDIRSGMMQFAGYSLAAMLVTLGAAGLFVWRFVHKPVRAIRAGTESLARGDLGVQIPVTSADELGGLAKSFNAMSHELAEARHEINAFTAQLEDRVRAKTAELQQAHQAMIQAEKLTSLGKLAAVVAHEINNPLSGILTYAKLLRKWIERGDDLAGRAGEMRDSLQLIESESRRCGEIVRSLLMFARAAPLNVSDVDVNAIVRQCIKLVEHKLDFGNIEAVLELGRDLPLARGDAGQIEQLLLALVMNAIEAMPHEGTLRIVTKPAEENRKVVMVVQDNGTGIPAAVLGRLFEPFVTTKEEGKGVGLGLAICRGIVERHQGHIAVASEPGLGTTFTITLPATAAAAAIKEPELALSAGR